MRNEFLPCMHCLSRLPVAFCYILSPHWIGVGHVTLERTILSLGSFSPHGAPAPRTAPRLRLRGLLLFSIPDSCKFHDRELPLFRYPWFLSEGLPSFLDTQILLLYSNRGFCLLHSNPKLRLREVL